MNSQEKTFAAIAKLKDIELELHRLKNALEITNKALDAPRPWVGLTDEEVLKFQDIVPNTLSHDLIEFAKAIEAKLKEKNT